MSTPDPALVKFKALPAAELMEEGADVMVVPYAEGTPNANAFMMYHHLPTGHRGRPARVPLRHAELQGLQDTVAAEMRGLTELAITTLSQRFPNNAYLDHLQFLQPDFWQLDQLDTRETIAVKAKEVNTVILHDALAALFEKYAQPMTIKKRNGDEVEVPPLATVEAPGTVAPRCGRGGCRAASGDCCYDCQGCGLAHHPRA